jgi:ABC-type glycerol-3-phosphate transport system permease component
MTITDGMGYFAATLVLATFCARQMVSLRSLAIGSNLAFITYGLAAQLWPIVTLHLIMLPLNVIRLREAFASLGPPEHLQWSNAVASSSGAKTRIK